MKFFFEIPLSAPEGAIQEIINQSKEMSNEAMITAYAPNGDTIIAIGDLIAPQTNQSSQQFLEKLVSMFDYRKVLEASGFFYLIYYCSKQVQIQFLTGFGSILPIYYTRRDNVCFISSDLGDISPLGSDINFTYIFERLIFNYSLSAHSIYKNIRRLPDHTVLVLNRDGISEKRYFDVPELFSTSPKPYQNSLRDLLELFIDEFERFLPTEPFYLSFTSGFDGRTLLGCSKYLGIEPRLYSFGTKDAADVQIPMAQAQKLGFDYHPILLDSEEYQSASISCGKEMIRLSSGEANFARAHYHYAAVFFSKNTRYLITGNFGSEVFRAFHNIGVMCTSWLYFIFQNDEAAIQKQLSEAPELLLLRNSESKSAIVEEIVEEIRKRSWFAAKNLSLNQRFYIFVFEEMFRKYFGPEIVMQSNYLLNRTPFLNYRFIKELYKTDLGGPHNNFFESRKMKRIKGQLFYAQIIKQTHPALLRLPTGKGYRPIDLLSWKGYFNLGWSYFQQKAKRKPESPDIFGVKTAFDRNRTEWYRYIEKSPIFDHEKLSDNHSIFLPNTIYTVLSLAYYMEILNDSNLPLDNRNLTDFQK